MALSVILTEQAQSDLEEIVSWMARDSSERARRFGNELIDQALAIGEFPQLGRTVPEIGDSSIRETIHGPYRIVYEILGDPETVYVLRFWHGARGMPNVW